MSEFPSSVQDTVPGVAVAETPPVQAWTRRKIPATTNKIPVTRSQVALAGRTPIEFYGAGRPGDMMDKARPLPTSPQAQQLVILTVNYQATTLRQGEKFAPPQ